MGPVGLGAMAGENEVEGSRLQLCDTKIVSKPGRLTDDQSKWSEWRFQFENFLACVDQRVLEEMALAERMTGPLEPIETDGVRQRGVQLYAVLASCASGKASRIVRSLRETRHGYEVWMLLVKEFEPQNDNRQLALLLQVVE